MPVALFSYHSYGSWLPNRKQGYVERHKGIQEPNGKLATIQRRLLKHEPFLFDGEVQRILIERFITICREEDYRAHAAATEPSHIHVLVGWRDFKMPQKKVGARIKNLLSLHLSRKSGKMGYDWFSRGQSREQVTSRSHFEHLVNVYLPKHRGVFWSEQTGWRV